MSKTKVVQDRIASLLIGQNENSTIKLDVSRISDTDVHVELKTGAAFLQINNLGEILDNTFYLRAIFTISANSTLNVQSTRFEYAVNASDRCTINSYFLKSEGTVEIKLSPNCKLSYKGSHTIKNSENCTIANANRIQ